LSRPAPLELHARTWPRLDRRRSSDGALARAGRETDPDLAVDPRRPGAAVDDECTVGRRPFRAPEEHPRPDRSRVRIRGARLAVALGALRPREPARDPGDGARVDDRLGAPRR